MQEAGGEGYQYRGQTVFESLFGGEEVVVIMERDDDVPPVQYDFLLLATSRTSTLQTELTAAEDLTNNVTARPDVCALQSPEPTAV